jgi:MoxR-like ATPase
MSENLNFARSLASSVKEEIHKVIVGMDHVIDAVLIGLLSEGHIVIEGPPGLAKTLLVKAFSHALDLDFKRIQFTSDMLPSDIIGSVIFDRDGRTFQFREGPLFANLVLADEINRAPPRSQSALLEAMQERQVTVEGVEHPLPTPFMVVATQNPVELEGTYPLPEAELDRFMMRVYVAPPGVPAELKILEMKNVYGDKMLAGKVIRRTDMLRAITAVKDVYVDKSVMDYMVRIISATRADSRLILGGSSRATVFLMYASKATAVLNGKGYVTPDHVKAIAVEVLNHRLIIKPEAQASSPLSEYRTAESIVRDILAKVEAPR